MAEEIWVCLHPGCCRREPYQAALKTHIFQQHDVERSEMKRGVDFGDLAEAQQVWDFRDLQAEGECSAFARALDSLGGADDFAFEAGG